MRSETIKNKAEKNDLHSFEDSAKGFSKFSPQWTFLPLATLFRPSELNQSFHPLSQLHVTHTRETPIGLTNQWAFLDDRTSFFAMQICFCATFRLLMYALSASAILHRRTRRPPARPKCGGTWPTDKPWSSQWPKPHLGKRCWHRPMREDRCKFRQSYPSP